MSAWAKSEPVDIKKLPQVFVVGVPFGRYRICNRDFVAELRRSEVGHLFARLINGAHVRVSVERTILEFGAWGSDHDLLKDVNFEWIEKHRR
jgi:hypothetical protein